MQQTVPELLSKGAFAQLINVTPGRVSQYISEGKLSGDALAGAGHRAKIRVGTALDQLRLKLDIGQMMGNGLETRLTAPELPIANISDPVPSAAILQGNAVSAVPDRPAARPLSVEEQLKAQKLLQAQIQSRKAAEEEEHRKGRFTETEVVRAEMNRLALKLIQTLEGALPDLANAVAAKFELPSRDVLHVLRSEFRSARERAAAQAHKDASEEPETVNSAIESAD